MLLAALICMGCGGSDALVDSGEADAPADPASSPSQDQSPTPPIDPRVQIGGARQGIPLALTTVVSSIAGSATGWIDGPGHTAAFNSPSGITTDGSALYVADKSNHRIRRIILATGEVSTLAGSTSGYAEGAGSAAQFNAPTGVTTDGTALYVADTGNNRIRKIVIATGVVSTLAGGARGYANGIGSAAQFDLPADITMDRAQLYVTDTLNNRIRKIVIATGAVTTLAGFGGAGAFADGPAASAKFNSPWGITTDGSSLYVADIGNHRIRKILISTGAVSTLAGSSVGAVDGLGASARFNGPYGVTTDGTRVYVSDTGNKQIRQIVLANKGVTTLAGQTGIVGSVDATGTAALFSRPLGLTTDGHALYIVDQDNQRIRKLQ